MFTPNLKIETSVKEIFTIPTPCNWKDLVDAIRYVQEYRMTRNRSNFDDSLTVEADEDGIHLIEVVRTSNGAV